jgi:hypothetical protein
VAIASDVPLCTSNAQMEWSEYQRDFSELVARSERT